MDAKTAVNKIIACNRMTGNEFLGYGTASEIADLIEQQAKQIQSMRNCVNCKIFESCKAIAPLPGCLEDGYKYWEWDGGNANEL